MSNVRNPFAIRKSDGKMILISDLDLSEYGLKCNSVCPACSAVFVARNCEKSNRVNHFAHQDNKDCEDAYTSGLYRLVHQILESGTAFYIPSLIITHRLPHNMLLNESNIVDYFQIISEDDYDKNDSSCIVIKKGKKVSFEEATLSFDNKNRIQAIELYIEGRSMAIKVMPPDTVCKNATVSPHKKFATLILDFRNDIDKIQNSKSEDFKKYLFSDKLLKYWLFSPLTANIHTRLLEINKREYDDYIKRQKRLLEERKQREAKQKKRAEEEREIAERQRISEEEARYVLAYEFVKDKSYELDEIILDQYGKRWFQCELCGEIKQEKEFWSYGGPGKTNIGKCYACDK